LDKVADLLQSRDTRWAGGFGDPRLLGREVEVFGVVVGNTRLVAGLPSDPSEEAFQGGQGGIARGLAQRRAAPVSPLVNKVALEAPRLLNVERFKVLVAGKGFDRAIAFATASIVCSLWP
jgi:hypothetical protein